MPPKTKKPSSGTKKPVAKPSRKQPAKKKQLATKKKPPPQKRPPPSPSSSSEDDNESRSDDNWRNASAAECKKRWGAECPYEDFGFDLTELYEFNDEEDQMVEDHEFSHGTLNLAPSEWKCPCTVVYTPPQSLVRWRTVSQRQSVTLSWAYKVKDDDEYSYHYNPIEVDGYGPEPYMVVDNTSLIRALARQDIKKTKKRDDYLSYTGSCGAGTTVFDVRIVEGTHADIKDAEIEDSEYASVPEDLEDSMVFEVRVREATVPINEWEDEISGMVRTPKRPKKPLKQLVKKLPRAEDLMKQVESLEAENAKLKRRLARYEGKVLDLTAEDSDDDAPPPRSKLRELHDKETTKRVAKVKKERDDHESRGELLDSMVTPLESQRRELQEMVSAAAEALMERDVPTRMLPDADTPFYYSQNSWEAEQEIPWNAEAGRPMSLAEGIAWVHDNAKPPRKRRR